MAFFNKYIFIIVRRRVYERIAIFDVALQHIGMRCF